MPEPFRLFAPPPAITEKLLLVHSDQLYLALSMPQIQQVLLNVPVRRVKIGSKPASVVDFREMEIPVVLGNRACPPLSQAIIVLLQAPNLKTGLLGVACSELPVMSAIAEKDWQTDVPPLPPPWQTDGKGYLYSGQLYIHATGIAKQ
ncbi:MAG: hypothetical protein ACK4QL_01425 [Pseudanabaenaceae cyanobacterium]